MNIHGIGTDIVEKPRIKKIWQKFGLNFANKILSDFEKQQLNSTLDKISFMAKRFAAKEACAKAIGTGFMENVLLSEIEIYNEESGKPNVKLLGKTNELAKNLNIKDFHVSIADEKQLAIAFAMALI